MSDEFTFATTLEAVAAGEALAHVAAIRDEVVRAAVKAFLSGATVVIKANGEEISRYVPEVHHGD